ncbi:MAG: hypothetical protein F6K40_15365 [Okeania sp. SIO3I5]|uniref:hypothetical protein n=1 Tax=Okeania sp. SIO3I5 TaxID=2607805 RepID=UPI0013BCB3DB|nr:hypothetical protein [Okeania sp. SIO3I5]NEQ37571.1 hypothetical protein [Okeania sp. SIO3I5]
MNNYLSFQRRGLTNYENFYLLSPIQGEALNQNFSVRLYGQVLTLAGENQGDF